jgi:hypothetical protein
VSTKVPCLQKISYWLAPALPAPSVTVFPVVELVGMPAEDMPVVVVLREDPALALILSPSAGLIAAEIGSTGILNLVFSNRVL